MTGHCGVTPCLIGRSFVIFYYLSNLLYSWVFLILFSSHLTVTCFLSRVTLQVTLKSFGEAFYSSLTWDPATSREPVVADCQSAIYKATRPVYWLGPHHEHVKTNCMIHNYHSSDSIPHFQSTPVGDIWCMYTTLLWIGTAVVVVWGARGGTVSAHSGEGSNQSSICCLKVLSIFIWPLRPNLHKYVG